jgi:hypothetical protein
LNGTDYILMVSDWNYRNGLESPFHTIAPVFFTLPLGQFIQKRLGIVAEKRPGVGDEPVLRVR